MTRISLTRPQIIGISAVALATLVLIVLIVVQRPGQAAPTVDASGSTAAPWDSPDAYVLDSTEGATVTVTEFLDFECEYCGALFPYIEEARKKYDGEVNFVFRNFLIPSHANTLSAALAVEAADQQGALEAMYSTMFTRQSEWGDQGVDHSATFRQYAEELGLDMAEYDASVADPASEARIQANVADGKTLGVQGTPTVFINGEMVELSSGADLDAAIAEALGR